MQGDDLRHDITGRMQTVEGTQIAGCQVYANNDIGPHRKRDIHRIVVIQSSVDKHHTIQPHRGKDCRNRHTGTHGKRKAASVKHIVFAADHIYGHTGKRYLEGIEIDRVMIAHRQVGKQVLQVLSLYHTVDHTVFLFTSERQGKDISFSFLLFGEKQVAALHLIAKQHRPVLRLDHLFNLIRAISDRVQSTDNRSHTGPCYNINRYARFLQNFQHPDMRHTFCPATAQHDSNLLALPRHRRPHKQKHEQKRQEFLHHCKS